MDSITNYNMNENGIKYYEYLKSKGLDVPSNYESFQNTLNDRDQASKYFSYLQSKKNQDPSLDVPPSFDSFYNTLKKKINLELARKQPNLEMAQRVSNPFKELVRLLKRILGLLKR